MPRPVPLQDLVGGAARDVGPFDRFCGGIYFARAACDPLNAKGVAGPLTQVTIAPPLPAALGHWIERIPFVGRAMEYFHVDRVTVERPVGLVDYPAIIARKIARVCVG